MFLHSVERSKIFTEFSPDEQEKFFGLKGKKVSYHIDTLYYAVHLVDDETDSASAGIESLICCLAELKERKQANPEGDFEFCGLSVAPTSFSIYQYHLSLKENFDIFIAKNIPNNDTPRVCVQLRSRMLVLDGVAKAVEKSFDYVQIILNSFGLVIKNAIENRIDYAFHTNLIQSSIDYFSDEYLISHLKSKLRLFHKIGNISDTVEINTFQLGDRKSNNVFFRAYNKTREVIEKNYKAFFFDIWLKENLINQYDFFVLNVAFENRSFNTGLLLGRMKWYLEYGKDQVLKDELKELINSCYVNADNAPQIEKKLKGLLPDVTIITNIEFQTKRRFYVSCESFMEEMIFRYEGKPELQRIYKVLSCQREICDYLTTNTVCFVENKGKRSEKMTDWWKRINSCKIKWTSPAILELHREYDRHADLKRSVRRLKNCIAQFNILNRNSLAPSSFIEDISDALSYFNDNDFYGFASSPGGLPPAFRDFEYPEIQARKTRQYTGIIKEKTENKKEETEEGKIKMKVIVKTAEPREGISKTTNQPYNFTSALVLYDDGETADHITIDSTVCDPKKIKPGMRAEMRVSTDRRRVLVFEPIEQVGEDEQPVGAPSQGKVNKPGETPGNK